MDNKLIDKQWVDIVLPLAPESNLLFWSIVIGTLAIFTFTVVFTIWYRRPRQHLMRRIRKLNRIISVTNDYKHLLMQLEAALCHFHQLPYLYAARHVHTHWYAVFTQLINSIYQKRQPSRELTQQLLQQCASLLTKTDQEYAG
jgi:membrane protein required for beta-lactamase induction